jgi:hypothetical protein
MGDGGLLVLLLLVAILLLWMLVWGPKAKAAREERERLEAEARARREAELAKLKAERDDLLKSIRGSGLGAKVHGLRPICCLAIPPLASANIRCRAAVIRSWI